MEDGDFLFNEHQRDDQDSLSKDPTLEQAYQIVAATKKYMGNGRSEAAWNCAIHAPILNLANECAMLESKVGWENVYVYFK